MVRFKSIVLGLGLLALEACANGRVARLEKDVEELRDGLTASELRQEKLSQAIEGLRKENESLRESLKTRPRESDELSQPSQAPAPSNGRSAWGVAPNGGPDRAEELEAAASKAPADVSLLSSADELYSSAFANFQTASYHQSILQFNIFVERYPDHALADNALYWIGECWFGLKDYAQAAAAFQNVGEHDPKGRKVPDSLLKKAFCLQRLGKNQEALAALRELIRRYPKSPSAAKAQAALKELQQTGGAG